MTGLAAGWASGLPVYEAEEFPGGICSSYYLRSGSSARMHTPPPDDEAYRFEIGGGHWIFGGDAFILQFMHSLAPLKSYSRESAVYLPERDLMIPYPLQNSLKYLDTDTAQRSLSEMAAAAAEKRSPRTMAEWLRHSFGSTLYKLFFGPFHQLYTAGLWEQIAPQDAYKSPVDLSLAIQGAFDRATAVGYNTTFVYPKDGLSSLTQRMAAACDVRYGKRVTAINCAEHVITFADGTHCRYEKLISTLPLNRVIRMAGIDVGVPADPSPSVLVMNIGARKGRRCPREHWIYVPSSNCGFHRVGFYSNVDSIFLPASRRASNDCVSIYVEKSYAEGTKPSAGEVAELGRRVVEQLQAWHWIGDAEVVDPTWIDVAYTWSYPGSSWKQRALKLLQERDIYQVGRYARWVFQGIADSIRDGFVAGAASMAVGANRVVEAAVRA